MTQNENILNILKAGKSITPLYALNKIGCLRLSARIYDLRKQGYKIKTNYYRKQDKTFAEYYMPNLMFLVAIPVDKYFETFTAVKMGERVGMKRHKFICCSFPFDYSDRVIMVEYNSGLKVSEGNNFVSAFERLKDQFKYFNPRNITDYIEDKCKDLKIPQDINK